MSTDLTTGVVASDPGADERTPRELSRTAPGRRSFQRQLFLSFLLAVALPVLLLGLVRISLFLSLQTATREQRLAESASAAARLVATYLEGKRSVVTALADFVAEVGEGPQHRVGQRLAELHQEHPSFLTFQVLAPDERPIVSERVPSDDGDSGALAAAPVHDRPSFSEPRRTGETYVSNGFVDRGAGGPPIIAISAPWYDAEGHFGGVVEGSLALGELLEQLTIFARLPAIELFVVDGTGHLLWSGPERRDAVLAAIDLDALGARLENEPERRLIVGAAVVEGFGWRIVVQQPRTALLATVRPQIWVTLAWMFLAFIIAAAASALLARRIERPLARLAEAVEGLDVKRLDGAVLPALGRAPREIALFATALRDLVRRLGESYREISRVLAEREATIESRTAELRASEARARLLVDESLAFVATHALDGEIRTINPAACAALGLPVEALVGRRLEELVPMEIRALVPPYLERIRAQEHDEGLLELRTASGERAIWRYHNRIVAIDGAPVVLAFAIDVTEQQRAQALLAHRAENDPLTGLARPEVFRRKLEEAIGFARRGGSRCAVLYLDLDGFKPINDEHGHAAGDEVLRQVGERLRRRARGTDTVARLGGDEFGVLLFEVADRAQAETVAAILRRRISEPIAWQDAELRVGASVGVALVPEDGSTAEELIRHADASMFERKRGARDAR